MEKTDYQRFVNLIKCARMQLREKLCGHWLRLRPSKPFQQPSRPLQLRYVSAEKSNNTLSGVSGTDGSSMWEAEVQRCVTDVATAVKPFCKNEQERRPRPSVAKPTQILKNCSAARVKLLRQPPGKSALLCCGWLEGFQKSRGVDESSRFRYSWNSHVCELQSAGVQVLPRMLRSTPLHLFCACLGSWIILPMTALQYK